MIVGRSAGIVLIVLATTAGEASAWNGVAGIMQKASESTRCLGARLQVSGVRLRMLNPELRTLDPRSRGSSNPNGHLSSRSHRLVLVAKGARTLTDSRMTVPTAHQVWRVITLHDYNTRVVVIGTMLLGVASGTVGTFMLLRKRALVSDAISHATLPGIAIGFMVMVAMGGDGKFLPGLLLAAVVAAVAGVGSVLCIRHLTRLKEDAAMGIVLSVYFGLGVCLLGVIQKMAKGNAAGLESFIYGRTASMVMQDAVLIGLAAVFVMIVSLLLLKEFTLVCFDQAYAGAQGWPTAALDIAMMILVVVVTVVGLQAVGLILVVALLIIPPSAARFWTDELTKLLAISAVFGAISGLVGSGVSAVVPKLPAGAIIVTVASMLFAVSLLFGARRGVLRRVIEYGLLRRRVALQHLLRAMYERYEKTAGRDELPRAEPVPWPYLLKHRSWTTRRLAQILRSAQRKKLLTMHGDGHWQLTELGLRNAARITRNHRLWEIYLITHADIAPSHVDRDADMVEHILGWELVRRLEVLLQDGRYRTTAPQIPASPHAMEASS